MPPSSKETKRGSNQEDNPIIPQARLDSASLETGEQLLDGRFIIRESLGRGSSGEVYRAIDNERGHEVALKVLYLNEAEELTQLKKEFRILKGLSHPGLVELYELHLNHTPFFFSMPVLAGQPFDLALSEATTPFNICRRLAEALDYLHYHQRVHRDLKPTNILVRAPDEVVILDFGLSINLQANSQDALRAGSRDFMAPEILAGNTACPAADVYAVGVLIYKGLTGHFPVRQETTKLSNLLPKLPQEFCAMVEEMLASKPRIRPTMRAFSKLCRQLSEVRVLLPGPTLRASSRSIFWGRNPELESLNHALRDVKLKGDCQVVHLAGEPGMGKSRLLDEFQEQHPTTLTFRSTCFENEKIAYQLLDGLIDQLKEILRLQDDRKVQRLLTTSEIKALVRLFPELKTIPAFYQADSPLDTNNIIKQRELGEQALAQLLIRLAESQPSVFIFDDVQWGDVDSAQTISRIFSPSFKHRALFIFSYRSDAERKSKCLQELLDGSTTLEDFYRCHKISLGPLNDNAARELLNRNITELPAKAQPEKIITHAAGSPFVILEIAAEFRRGVHEQFSLQDIIKTRLDALSFSSRRVFELLCCSPAPLPIRIVFQILEIDLRLQGENIRNELQQLSLIRSRIGGLDMEVTHDLFRISTQHLMGNRILDYHLRLARHFEQDVNMHARCALHFRGAGLKKEGSFYFEKAAHQAEHKLAFLQAAQNYEEALLTESPGGQRGLALRLAMAQAYKNAGYPNKSAKNFLEVSTLCTEEKVVSSRAHAAEQLLMSGQLTLGERSLSNTLKSVGLTWPKRKTHLLVQIIWNRILTSLKEKFKKGKSSPASAKKVRAITERLQALSLANSISYVSALHGVANNARYLRVALSSNDSKHQGIALGMESVYRAAAGTQQRSAVESYYAKAKLKLNDNQSDFEIGFLAYVRAQTSYLLHDYQGACNEYKNAESALLRHGKGINFQLTSSRILWASALTYCGRNREFFRRTRLWAADAKKRGDLYGEIALRIQLARTEALHHLDREKLRVTLESLLARWRSPHFSLHDSLARYSQISLDLALGQPDDALRGLAQLKKDANFSFSRVQSARIFHAQQSAKAYLQLASLHQGRKRQQRERQALEECRKLYQENATWATLLAQHIETSIALGQKDNLVEGAAALRRICAAYQEQGLHLYVAAVCLQLLSLEQSELEKQYQGILDTALKEADFSNAKTILNLYAPRMSRS